MSFLRSLIRPAFLVVALGACAGCSAPRSEAGTPPPVSPGAEIPALPDAWKPLAARLDADGLYTPEVARALGSIGPTPSQDPMGRKIRELYTSAFLKTEKKPEPGTARPAPPVYPGVITPESVSLCRTYLETHKAAFDGAEARYGVPREIAVALLYVETRLGAFLGKEKAFTTLAGMAASTDPGHIPQYLEKLPGAETRTAWIQDKMRQRSDWAYKELAAFIRHTRAGKLDPLSMPGSIYGAVGLCQFMPSNIAPYGADGDGDGVINLFVPADAAASLSKYLVRHGWKSDAPRAKRHAVLKTYNRLNIYAETILRLAEAVARPEGDQPSNGKK